MNLLFYFFYILNSSNKIIDEIKNSGIDERAPMFVNLPGNENNEQHLKTLLTIHENFYKKNMLIILENPNYSNIHKLELIKNYKNDLNLISYKTNIESGGLYNDWHFDLEEF